MNEPDTTTTEHQRRDPDPTGTIVVGVEGSPDSLAALRWAAEEARLRGAIVRVVHAYFTSGGQSAVELLDQRAQEIIDAAVTEATIAAPGVHVIGELARNEPAARALLSRSEGADLLVVGSRGLGGFEGLLVGSVSHQCVQHARCSVVVIRRAGPA